MIVGVSVGSILGCSKLMRTKLKCAKMVTRGHVSGIFEAESSEIKWNRNLPYGLLQEEVVSYSVAFCWNWMMLM